MDYGMQNHIIYGLATTLQRGAGQNAVYVALFFLLTKTNVPNPHSLPYMMPRVSMGKCMDLLPTQQITATCPTPLTWHCAHAITLLHHMTHNSLP